MIHLGSDSNLLVGLRVYKYDRPFRLRYNLCWLLDSRGTVFLQVKAEGFASLMLSQLPIIVFPTQTPSLASDSRASQHKDLTPDIVSLHAHG